MQFAVGYNNINTTGPLYERTYINNVWQNWKKICD